MTTNLILILLVSAALAAALLLSLRRGRQEPELPGPQEDGLDAVRLPPRRLMDRFLSTEDIEYAASLRLPGLFRFLLRERRRLALEWLHTTRREAGRVMKAHSAAAKHAEALAVGMEFRLLWQYLAFLAVYQVLAAAVSLYGPIHTRRFVRSVNTMTDLLATLGGRLAETAMPVAIAAGSR